VSPVWRLSILDCRDSQRSRAIPDRVKSEHRRAPERCPLCPWKRPFHKASITRIPERGGWDDQAVGEIFKEFSTASLDFDIEITGFSMPKIDSFIGKRGIAGADRSNDPIDFIGGALVTRPGMLSRAG
jgi:hypothetical protein